MGSFKKRAARECGSQLEMDFTRVFFLEFDSLVLCKGWLGQWSILRSPVELGIMCSEARVAEGFGQALNPNKELKLQFLLRFQIPESKCVANSSNCPP